MRCPLLYNHGCNILQLHNVLVQVGVATSKIKLDIKYNKFDIQVAIQVLTI